MANKKLKKDIAKAAAVNNANDARMVNGFSFDLSSDSEGGGTLSTGVLAPSITSISPFVISDPSQGLNVTDFLQQHQDFSAAVKTEMKSKYDYAMSKNGADFLAEGYFVATDNGSIFKGTPDSGIAWLPIQDIQEIENAAGTPGALLLHLQQPALAKDTAGYEGGSSSTWLQSNGVETPVPPVTPIPEIQTLPPVVTSTETVSNVGTTTPVFTTTGTPAPTSDGNTAIPVTSVPLPTANLAGMTMPGGKYWWLWYALAALAIILYVKYGRK